MVRGRSVPSAAAASPACRLRCATTRRCAAGPPPAPRGGTRPRAGSPSTAGRDCVSWTHFKGEREGDETHALLLDKAHERILLAADLTQVLLLLDRVLVREEVDADRETRVPSAVRLQRARVSVCFQRSDQRGSERTSMRRTNAGVGSNMTTYLGLSSSRTRSSSSPRYGRMMTRSSLLMRPKYSLNSTSSNAASSSSSSASTLDGAPDESTLTFETASTPQAEPR